MITFNEIINKKKEDLKKIERIKCIRNKKFYRLKDFIKDKPIIAEIKKSSPSIGVINMEVNVAEQAVKYAEYGAGAISVLTDNLFFAGDFEDLYEVSRMVKLPVLCKDFIMNKMQILNAHISGADLILIIVYILDDALLNELVEYSKSLEMDIIFEIINTDDFERIKKYSPEYVLVNSRNFKSMKIEINRAKKILSRLKGDFIKIAASGIKLPENIIEFREAGADAFLVGTSLMKSENLKKDFNEFYKCL